MKKNLLWTMAAAVALAGCSDTETVEAPQQVQEQNAIAFSTYVGDNAQSRAVIVDDIYIQTNGFGVNAYYTGQDAFNSDDVYSGNAIFMENTKVTYNAGKDVWTYSPVKYWPNNTGDKVSFFAYAPYGGGFTLNQSKIDYTVPADAKSQIDIIYHKADGDEESGYEKTIDMTKPTVNKAIKFNFQHALARIAFGVKAVVDDTSVDSDNLLDGNTRINVRKVALVGTDETEEEPSGPFYSQGTLDMVSGTWSTDEAEGQAYILEGDHFYRAVEENGEKVAQLTKFNPSQQLNDEDSYLMIIPQDFSGEDTKFKIYIEYDVISEEVNNNGQSENTTNDGSTITNKIFSDALSTDFIAGQAYKFTLMLGMTSVKVEAEVADWSEETNQDVWLPNNSEDEGDGDDEGDDDDISVLDDSTVASASLEGEGTEDSPFLIEDAADLLYLCERGENLYDESPGKYYKLVNDIQVNSSNWTSIITFKGTFDGNDKTISGTLNCSEYGAVFGHFSGTVKKLNVSATIAMNNAISGGETIIGGICGFVGDGLIEECTFSGTIMAPSMDLTGDDYPEIYIGGIVGEILNAGSAEIKNCTSSGTINLPESDAVQAGGIIGYSLGGKVVGCIFNGAINIQNSSSDKIGSIAGATWGDSGIICTTCNKNESESNSGLPMIGSDDGSAGTSCDDCSNG